MIDNGLLATPCWISYGSWLYDLMKKLWCLVWMIFVFHYLIPGCMMFLNHYLGISSCSFFMGLHVCSLFKKKTYTPCWLFIFISILFNPTQLVSLDQMLFSPLYMSRISVTLSSGQFFFFFWQACPSFGSSRCTVKCTHIIRLFHHTCFGRLFFLFLPLFCWKPIV